MDSSISYDSSHFSLTVLTKLTVEEFVKAVKVTTVIIKVKQYILIQKLSLKLNNILLLSLNLTKMF